MVIRHLARFHQDEQGATAIEYGLIAALIVIAMMVGINTFADENEKMYNKVSTAIDQAIT